MSLTEIANDYFAARSAYDEAHAVSQARHREMKAAEAKLIDAMSEADVRSADFNDGLKVTLSTHFGISVTEANNELWRQWLIETVGDDTQFVKQAVNKKAVAEWLKSQIERGELGAADVPEAFGLNQSPTLSVRGWNKQ